MYGLEKNLGVSYEELNRGWQSIEARRKGLRVSLGSLKKVAGSKDKGVRV
jgi:hypothetical protein